MKTAAELEISTEELIALQNVRDGLRSGQYVHIEDPATHSDKETKEIFNMGIPMETYSCGQVGCIGGWMAAQMGMPIRQAKNYVINKDEDSCPLGGLFYPPEDLDFEKITPAVAADAIDSFLETGHADWPEDN